MEFELRQENISVVIMPIPFVYTAKAIENTKVKQNLMFEPGITSEVRVANMNLLFLSVFVCVVCASCLRACVCVCGLCAMLVESITVRLHHNHHENVK